MAFAVFFVFALAAFVYPRASASLVNGGEPQQQKRRRTKQSGGNTARAPATRAASRGVNYSRFFHDRHHVKYDKPDHGNCSDCHTLSSPLQYDIKDYPDHPSCVNCHRQQFFTGARPVICTVCHKAASPRDDRRFDFPKPGADVTREFPGRFPHALHQSLLAQARPAGDVAGALRLVRASFNGNAAQTQTEENCATCHASYDKTKPDEAGFFPGAGWPDNMLPGKGTFRKIPNGPEGHRTCFVCHASAEKSWKSPAPVANDCAGCHSKAAPAALATAIAASSISTTPAVMAPARTAATLVKFSFTSAPLPPRKVFNFQHEGGGEGGSHEEGCTTCHINITQEQTLIVKPDVPIASCALCHISGGKKSSLKKGTDTTITTEMDAWLASRKACLSCHTIEIGNRQPPCSHYYADRRAPPAELQCK
ncbi:MAG: Class cytochrome family [Blastocatellia bacterium]|nr:Class cytochrome family [Blastocatellia bacterium]